MKRMNVTAFINDTGTIGIIYNAATTNITGSEFLTLLGLIVLIIIFFTMFRIPMEMTAIFVLPLMLIFMAYSNNFFAIGGVFLIYLGFLVARNYFINQ